jgi:hypothetical protein
VSDAPISAGGNAGAARELHAVEMGKQHLERFTAYVATLSGA